MTRQQEGKCFGPGRGEGIPFVTSLKIVIVIVLIIIIVVVILIVIVLIIMVIVKKVRR